MPTKEIAGTTVEVSDDGFFVDANQWTEEMATPLAEEWGVPFCAGLIVGEAVVSLVINGVVLIQA